MNTAFALSAAHDDSYRSLVGAVPYGVAIAGLELSGQAGASCTGPDATTLQRPGMLSTAPVHAGPRGAADSAQPDLVIGGVQRLALLRLTIDVDGTVVCTRATVGW